jgi:hypothetical protein
MDALASAYCKISRYHRGGLTEYVMGYIDYDNVALLRKIISFSQTDNGIKKFDEERYIRDIFS